MASSIELGYIDVILCDVVHAKVMSGSLGAFLAGGGTLVTTAHTADQ